MSQSTDVFKVEDHNYCLAVNGRGEICSIIVKAWGQDLVHDRRLARGFKFNLPLPGRLDHYVLGNEQQAEVIVDSPTRLRVRCESLRSGLGEFAIRAEFLIELTGEQIEFSCRIENATEHPLAEIWFPMIGGLHGIGERMETECVVPGYTGPGYPDLFRKFSGGWLNGGFLGNEDACVQFGYPGLAMPWFSIVNRRQDRALYLAEYNTTLRRISLVFQMTPGIRAASPDLDRWPTQEEVGPDAPLGIVFSRVMHPHTKHGTFTSGTCVLRAHAGDWHQAAKIYRQWFLERFPFRRQQSWLRKEQAWFTSIIYQPEDRVVADLPTYARWMKDAIDADITTGELIGWDKGGLERDYPEYVPEEKLGGWDGYRQMLRSVHDAGGRVLTFANYQVLDSCTDWYRRELHKYRRMDSFGQTENSWAWGESTLNAAANLDVRRHVPATVAVPGFTDLIDGYLTRLAREGSDGLQLDKVCGAEQLDFNPGHNREPDLPMCEDLVRAIERLFDKCVAINPNFCLASEAIVDRMIPFVDVFYRAASEHDISPLRYAFPEWTACVHVSAPFDFVTVNAAIMLGAVLVVEPFNYTRPVSHPAFAVLARYIREMLLVRKKYLDRIFLADYLDRLEATVQALNPADAKSVDYRVHARWNDRLRTIVMMNRTRRPVAVQYALQNPASAQATIILPFAGESLAAPAGELTLPPEQWALILEHGPDAPVNNNKRKER